MSKTRNANELFEKWRKDPDYVKEYDALEEEFAIANALIKARSKANLTQAEVAERMNTTQSAIARLEGGANPSISMLRRYAKATGTRLEINLSQI
ncbi:MAG: helix-turn-helix transcriptional regulator [Verrucomicrobiota bacterium]